MSIRLRFVVLLAFVGVIALSGARAAESPYYKNVSDIELETAVKGTTYDKGPVNYFSNDHASSSKKSNCDCPCKCPDAVKETLVPASTTGTPNTSTSGGTSAGARIKYILDGKPVYEEGAKGVEGSRGAAGDAGAGDDKDQTEAIKAAIERLATSGWKDAQAFLIETGKPAIPLLIDALSNSTASYNLGGHTKADAGRAVRQRTIGEVSAELLTEIVSNHSNYNGDLPAADQQAWRAWWTKNAETVTFAAK